MNDDVDHLAAQLLQTPVVVRVNATSRHGRLMSFLADSSSSTSSSTTLSSATQQLGHNRTLVDSFWLSLEVATYLAVQDFNARDSVLVPSLQERLQSCDLSLSIQMRDTEFSPIVAVKQYQEGILNASSTQQQTMAIVGGIRSTVTASLATVSGTQGIPQISGLASSEELNDKSTFPYFARTIPDDLGSAIATCVFLQSLGVTRFALLYVNDVYGVGYFFDLMESASNLGIEIVAAAYYESDAGSLANALNIIRSCGLRYIVGVLGFRTTHDTLLDIYLHEFLGVPEYTWLLSESVGDIAISMFSFVGRDVPLAKALNGAGVVLPRPPPENNAMMQSQLEAFVSDKARVRRYIQDHAETDIFPDDFQLKPESSMGALLFYDAVMALGIAACELEQDLFAGPELYQQLISTSFDGASGYVSFDNNTGTRVAAEVSYRIVNLLENTAPQANNNASSTVAYDTTYINVTDQTMEVVRPFMFADGTSVAPAMAPSPSEDLNLVPTLELVAVFIIVAFVATMSIVFAVWTIRNRKKRAVRASQPIFLVLLCIGTFLLSCSTIFQAFQEPLTRDVLNFACNAYPWFVSIGFTTTFSALFSKTWRIHRLYRSAQQFRRVKVRVRDVIWPFAVLFIGNTIVLTTWMIVNPLDWRRIPISKDVNGQTTSSYGTCFHFQYTEGIFFLTLLVLNLTALVISNYVSFQARNLPSEFNETFYVALTNAILLEASVLGAPVIMLVKGQPKALFLVRSILLLTLSLAVLIPIFIPKILGMDGKEETRFLKWMPDEIAEDGRTQERTVDT